MNALKGLSKFKDNLLFKDILNRDDDIDFDDDSIWEDGGSESEVDESREVLKLTNDLNAESKKLGLNINSIQFARHMISSYCKNGIIKNIPLDLGYDKSVAHDLKKYVIDSSSYCRCTGVPFLFGIEIFFSKVKPRGMNKSTKFNIVLSGLLFINNTMYSLSPLENNKLSGTIIDYNTYLNRYHLKDVVFETNTKKLFMSEFVIFLQRFQEGNGCDDKDCIDTNCEECLRAHYEVDSLFHYMLNTYGVHKELNKSFLRQFDIFLLKCVLAGYRKYVRNETVFNVVLDHGDSLGYGYVFIFY